MNINTISYLIADAFHTMKKDIKNELISLGTMLATMVLIAVAYLVYVNANIIIGNTKDESSNVMAYLEVGLSDEEVQKIGFEIEKKTFDATFDIEDQKKVISILIECFRHILNQILKLNNKIV